MTTLSTVTPASSATVPNSVPQTVTLQSLAQVIPLSTFWINEQEVLASRTAKYRRYYDGDHDIKLTAEMRAILQSDGKDGSLAINLMPSVVDTKVDRCVVQGIEATEPDGESLVTDVTAVAAPPVMTTDKVGPNLPTKWAQEVADLNYFDILQGDVTEATVRDGNGYVMVAWDNDKKQVRLTFEPAWDGQTGMLMVYRSHNIPEPYAAIKVWQVEGQALSGTTASIVTRVNVYYADRVEKFESKDGSAFAPFIEDGSTSGVYAWTNPDTTGIGLPVIHFRNAGRENYGVSELRNAISPQDALNRFNYSSIVATELTAFAIYKALGFTPDPAVITPGVIINLAQPIPKEQQVEFDKIAPSEISPIIDVMSNARMLISEITRTPSPDLATSSNTSGEYLKQLEVGLVGKCKRYMTRAGQAWEQVFDMAWNVQNAFGTKKPPDYKRFFCRWQSPEIRNDATEVQNATALDPIWGPRQTLRAIAPIYDLDEEQIEKIMDEKKQDAPPPVTPGAAQVDASGQPIAPSSTPSITGDKLPTEQATKVAPITDAELASVGAMHRRMMGNG